MQRWIKLYSSLSPTWKGCCHCYSHVIFKTADPKLKGEMQSHLLGHTEDGFFAFFHWNFNIILHMFHCQQSSFKKQGKKTLKFLPGEVSFIVATKQLHFLSNSTRWQKWLLQIRLPREEINVQSHTQEAAAASWQCLQLQIDNFQHRVQVTLQKLVPSHIYIRRT